MSKEILILTAAGLKKVSAKGCKWSLWFDGDKEYTLVWKDDELIGVEVPSEDETENYEYFVSADFESWEYEDYDIKGEYSEN